MVSWSDMHGIPSGRGLPRGITGKHATGSLPARSAVRKKAPTKTPKPATPVDNRIDLCMADPLTPSLTKKVVPPSSPPLVPFVVTGYTVGSVQTNAIQKRAGSVYATVANTLNIVNALSDIKMPKWQGTRTLLVVPKAGVDLNAYYNRRALAFFWYRDINRNEFYTSDSHDIIAHEAGHAILDSFRPDLWSASGIEAGAFHESFADMIAMLSVMQYNEVLQYAIQQTGGDFTKNNIIAGLAEQFGQVFYDLTRGADGANRNWLRNAINDYTYVNPSTLRDDLPDNQLSSEVHNFSRLFTATFWDIIVMIYNRERSRNIAPMPALQKARDLSGRLLLKSIQRAPLSGQFYNSMGRTMLAVVANSTTARDYHGPLTELLARRGIIGGLSMLSTHDHLPGLCKCHTHCLKLCDHMPLRIQSDNPLYHVDVEVPGDTEEDLYAAQDMIEYLHRNKLVGPTSKTPFEISDGKLVRSHFKCGCGGNPTKYQPEFLKPWKSANNAGCCGGCKQTTTTTPSVVRKRGCVVRYRVPR